MRKKFIIRTASMPVRELLVRLAMNQTGYRVDKPYMIQTVIDDTKNYVAFSLDSDGLGFCTEEGLSGHEIVVLPLERWVEVLSGINQFMLDEGHELVINPDGSAKCGCLNLTVSTMRAIYRRLREAFEKE